MSSTIIILETISLALLALLIQFKKDHKTRSKLEALAQLPVLALLLGNVYWFVLYKPYVSNTASRIALGFLLLPVLTYAFSPAFKDEGSQPEKHRRHPKQRRPARHHSA
jgi:hypothetical protein